AYRRTAGSRWLTPFLLAGAHCAVSVRGGRMGAASSIGGLRSINRRFHGESLLAMAVAAYAANSRGVVPGTASAAAGWAVCLAGYAERPFAYRGIGELST